MSGIQAKFSKLLFLLFSVSSDDSEGIGPVLLGNFKLNGRKQIRWEAGVIFGLDNETADQTCKFLLEFEF